MSRCVREEKKEESWWSGERVQRCQEMERDFVRGRTKDGRRDHIGLASQLGRRHGVVDEEKSLGTF